MDKRPKNYTIPSTLLFGIHQAPKTNCHFKCNGYVQPRGRVEVTYWTTYLLPTERERKKYLGRKKKRNEKKQNKKNKGGKLSCNKIDNCSTVRKEESGLIFYLLEEITEMISAQPKRKLFIIIFLKFWHKSRSKVPSKIIRNIFVRDFYIFIYLLLSIPKP